MRISEHPRGPDAGAAGGSAPGAEPGPGAGWTVLVVDDDPDGRLICVTMLRHHGYRTLAASGGPEALRLAREHRPDVAILDLRLPGLPGTEVARVLRADPDTAHILLIAYTAHAGAGAREMVLAAGFHGYLSKPCTPTEILERVRALTAAPRPRPS